VEREVFHCERCGAPYLAGVGICYSCGAAIGEPELPTAPVQLPVHLRSRVATVPLPPATATAVAATSASDHPVARAVGPWWKRLDTRVRPLSAVLLAASLVVVVAELLVLNQRLIPPQVPLSNVYHDPAHRFHFVQPALWQATLAADGVTLDDATGVSRVLITVSPADVGETAATRAAALREEFGLSAGPELVAGGVTWAEDIGTVESSDGGQSVMLVLVTQHGASIYVVECSSPEANFAANSQLVFLPLVRSFAFGG
jgi:hypothetical protein